MGRSSTVRLTNAGRYYLLQNNGLPDFKSPKGPNYSRLINPKNVSGLPAADGITARICRTSGSPSGSNTIGTVPGTKQANLVYRIPVPGKLTLTVGEDSKSFAIAVPQWAGPSYLKLGKGGMFGSREASAKFDAMGMPSELSYGSGGAATDIAGLIDTGREGVTSLKSAELTRLQSEIAVEEARQKLAALRAGGDTADD